MKRSARNCNFRADLKKGDSYDTIYYTTQKETCQVLLQKVKKICKAGTAVIIDRLNGDQWLGAPGALYPVFGGIDLTESSVRTLFDVRSDDESFAVRTLSEGILTDRGYTLGDVDDEEHALATTSWTLEYQGRSFIPLTAAADTSTVAFIDSDYLAPLKDCDELSLWLRFANNGTYVVAKSGFLVVALIAVEKIPDTARLSLAMIASNADSVGNDKYKKAELVPLEEIK